MAGPTSTKDWEAIEIDYRTGVKTLRQIGEEHKVTHVAIARRAKRDGWTRDLAAKIKAKALAKLAKAAVVRKPKDPPTAEQLVTEQTIVEANAEMQADIILAHRADIRRYRAIAATMVAQLEAETGDPELFSQIGEILSKSDEHSKLDEAYRKAISLPQRIDGVKKLAETLKVLIGLEREAFGIDSRMALDEKPAVVSIQF